MVEPVSSKATPAVNPQEQLRSAQDTPVQTPTPEKPVVVAVQPQSDTVDISVPAQARLLRMQGLSVVEIALQLRLDVPTVNQYLDLTKAQEPRQVG